MIFYKEATTLGLVIASIPAILSLFVFFFFKKKQLALYLLLASAFLLRFLMISLDPFLHDWDERYHALVAKNMMESPFYPMLRTNPIMEYDYKSWCCNHIWVHKQPLFMWQMALSMKLFGVNEIALRLPSAIMGTLMTFFTFRIGEYWTKSTKIAFIAALLMCISFYNLELTAARLPLDHNDISFAFYITASIWAFSRYLQTNLTAFWGITIGLFVGCAILIKWLTAFLIFGAWGLYLLQHKKYRKQPRYYLHIIGAFLLSCLIFVPWQVYILHQFPLESAATYELNHRHIFEVLDGQKGGIFFHLKFLNTAYAKILLPFLGIGIISIFRNKIIDKKLTISFLAMIVVLFAFFTIVATKMGAFTYPVAALMLILIAYGMLTVFNFLRLFIKNEKTANVLSVVCLLVISFYSMKPWNIAKYRSIDNELRNAKIHNSKIYKSLDENIYADYTIINVKKFEDTELMFYKNINAYQWCPDAITLDSLQAQGHQFAVFSTHNQYILPDYICRDTSILQIDMKLQ